MKTFNGFNNPLQQVHFYENYLETTSFPESVFKGFIVESIDPKFRGKIRVRAKGDFTIHGVTKEMIIETNLDVREDAIIFSTDFKLRLDEFNIDVPNIVKQKIAETILVTVNGRLEQNEE